MKSFSMKRTVGALTLAGLAVSAGACGYEDANPEGLPVKDQELVIGIPEASADHEHMDEHMIAGLQHYYSEAMDKDGRYITAVSVPHEKRFEALRTGEIQLTYGCVGELVNHLDGHKGQLMRQLFEEDEDQDPATWRNIMHGTLTSLLPGDLAISDTGIAVGCDDDSLPQNIVAIYEKSVMDRGDRTALNHVAGGVSSDMLREQGESTAATHDEGEPTATSQDES